MDWLNKESRQFLKGGYLSEGESAEQRIRDIADNAERINGIKGFSDKFYGYMEQGFYSLASPVWSNFGKERGMPISCFGSSIEDDMGDILFTQSEVGMMSKLGGGTSGYLGNLRGRGSKISDNGHSSGAVHFAKLFDTMIDVCSQGSSRRGQFSPYLPISHPDADEFLDIGTEGNPIQNLVHGVTVGTEWLNSMIDGDIEKRKLWAKLIQRRGEIGYPYILFEDNANGETKPDVYKDMKIQNSNLCNEIMLPNNTEESFVCCLSSMNVLHYDKWKDTDAVETLVYFLDAVMTEFIVKLETYKYSDKKDDRQVFMFMEKAYNFAVNHRSLGMGVLGWHSLLQSKMFSFESKDAAKLNVEVFKTLQEQSYNASEQLAKMFGEPKLLKGHGRRNTTLMAVAPTTSSAFILGQVSQSIEPLMSNYYVKDLQKIKTTIKNPFLDKLFTEKGINNKDVWKQVRDSDGSVQGLYELTDHEKDVFKTFSEINQEAIVDQASTRQKYIDQGQSLNLMIHPNTPTKDVNALYLKGWKQGVKAFYYQHSMNAAQQMNVGRNECKACEG